VLTTANETKKELVCRVSYIHAAAKHYQYGQVVFKGRSDDTNTGYTTERV